VISLSSGPEAAIECRSLIDELDEEISRRAIGHVVKAEALLALLLLTLVCIANLDESTTNE
jgi:hypothetical protein